MAAMQAQVEPHFLFNTLASIDHLIETDPARASTMQKNLIALLRASMPTMREAGDGGPRDLGRELAVIRPYLEILKVRMEERLHTEIDVPDGLLSAEFPPMMIQTLVENAIKHGLEPKPEGGRLSVRAEIVHGKLAVTVADTGLGFGKAATAGTGVGLANIRERLQLLYGSKATLTVRENHRRRHRGDDHRAVQEHRRSRTHEPAIDADPAARRRAAPKAVWWRGALWLLRRARPCSRCGRALHAARQRESRAGAGQRQRRRRCWPTSTSLRCSRRTAWCWRSALRSRCWWRCWSSPSVPLVVALVAVVPIVLFALLVPLLVAAVLLSPLVLLGLAAVAGRPPGRVPLR